MRFITENCNYYEEIVSETISIYFFLFAHQIFPTLPFLFVLFFLPNHHLLSQPTLKIFLVKGVDCPTRTFDPWPQLKSFFFYEGGGKWWRVAGEAGGGGW